MNSNHLNTVSKQCHRLDEAANVTSKLTHDFGNVLTGILGFAELAVAEVPENSLASTYLREVLGVAKTGADGLKQLHLFCRRTAPTFTPTRLGDILTEAVTPMRRKWGDRVPLQIGLAADLPEIACDATSLQAALQQLLANACEALVERGSVTLDAQLIELTAADCDAWIGEIRPGRHVEITVSDTGVGMSEETQRRVCAEAFFTTKPGHRGLGLPIVYGIARRFGGGVRWDDRPGGGVVAHFALPAAP